MSGRSARVERTTSETTIALELGLDGGPIAIDTDVRFLDHMLNAFAKHARCGLTLHARGDGMDHHHLVEDVAIALGRAIAEALGDKRGIERFGSASVPLDDALIHAAIDLSGRFWLTHDVPYRAENLGDLKTEMIPHFFQSVAESGRFNLHLLRMSGENSHHLCEASFKAFARAFALAKSQTQEHEIPSTKGVLE